VDELLDQLLAIFLAVAVVVAAATATVTSTTSAAVTATAATGTALAPTFGRSGLGLGFLDRSVLNGRALDLFVSHLLKLQSAFARGVSKRLHAAVEQETATVENHLGDARGPCTLGDAAANLLR
jgi:hypothetical protein